MSKKITVIMVLVLLIVPISFAANSIGDDIGDVLSTDIITKVNGVAINSFNINGNTAVYVTELRKLGYDVNWNGEERKVTVSESPEKQPITLDTPGIQPFQKADNNQKIGSPIDDVLYTDIVTYMKGAEVESFNISGSTAIYANDFTRLGINLEWDGDNREVKLTKKQKTEEEIEALKLQEMSNYERILSYGELPDGVISMTTKKHSVGPNHPSDSEEIYELNMKFNTEDYPSATDYRFVYYNANTMEKEINRLDWSTIVAQTKYTKLENTITNVGIVDNYIFVLLDADSSVLGYKVLDADGNPVKVD